MTQELTVSNLGEAVRDNVRKTYEQNVRLRRALKTLKKKFFLSPRDGLEPLELYKFCVNVLSENEPDNERRAGVPPVLEASYESGTNGDSLQNLQFEAGAKMAERLCVDFERWGDKLSDQDDVQEAKVVRACAKICGEVAVLERQKKTPSVPA